MDNGYWMTGLFLMLEIPEYNDFMTSFHVSSSFHYASEPAPAPPKVIMQIAHMTVCKPPPIQLLLTDLKPFLMSKHCS